MDLFTVPGALTLDACTLTLCSAIALWVAPSWLHPAPIMLASHVYIVSVRLIQIALGFPTLAMTFAWPVMPAEVIRAGVASDFALLAMAAAWIVVGSIRVPVASARWQARRLTTGRMVLAAVLSISLGVIGTLVFGRHQTGGEASFANSGYTQPLSGFGGWGFCLLHYMFGFPMPLTLTTLTFLFVSMLGSTYRATLLGPAIFLTFVWLARRKKKSIPVAILPTIVVLWLLWLPMKPTVYALQAGAPPAEALNTGIEEAFLNFGQQNGSGIDFQFLDMIGSTMTLVDLHGSYFWGTTVAPLLVSPMPRFLWPEKPKVNQYQWDIDLPTRNMAEYSQTAGLVGEAYANFGWLGLVLVPFLLSLAYCWAFSRLSTVHLLHPSCLLYVVYIAVFLQVYRDGLISLIWFPFIHCAPMGQIVVFEWLWPARKRTLSLLERWRTRGSQPVSPGISIA